MDNSPLLSVRLMTYNHAAFIEQALDGIFLQQTNFIVEVVIGDDFSDDNTLDLIKKYRSTEKIKIRILKRQVGDAYWIERQKKGRLYNFVNILQNCKGKYVALLDGDDYWTDPYKLQKQVDFLEKEPKYVICAHESKELVEEEIIDSNQRKQAREDRDFKSIVLKGLEAETLSVVFRNQIREFPDWFFRTPYGDYPLFLLLTENNGLVKYLNETMGVYRVHDGGVWSKKGKTHRGHTGIKGMHIANEGFGYRYNDLFKDAIAYRNWGFDLKKYSFINYLKGEISFVFYSKYFKNKLSKTLKSFLARN